MILHHKYTRANTIYSKPFSTFSDKFVKPSNRGGGLWAILIFLREWKKKKYAWKQWKVDETQQ